MVISEFILLFASILLFRSAWLLLDEDVDYTAFRTWGGTMIVYHSNGNVLKVKQQLGHKQVKNSMWYIGKIEFVDPDFDTTSAATVEDILRLGKEGWTEYSVVKVGDVEHHCFRKPKRFSSYV